MIDQAVYWFFCFGCLELMNDLKCSNREAKKLQDRIVGEGLKFERLNLEAGLN